MQLIKGTFLLLALCLCSRSIWAEEDDTTGTETTESSSGISKEVTTNLETATTNLDTKITAAGALVTASKNSIKKKALENGVAALNVLKENAAKLKEELTAITTALGDSPDEQIKTTLEELNTWADEQVARASKTSTKAGINQAKTLTKNLVRRYSTDLPQATKGLTKEQTDFEKQVNNAIKTYTTHAKKLIGDMEGCEKATAAKCQSNIQGEKVSSSTAELKRLTKLGKQLTDSATYAKGRVEFLIAKSKKDQEQVEKEIDGIIKYQKDPNANDLETDAGEEEKKDEEVEDKENDE